MLFKWMQIKGGDEPWKILLADQESAIVESKKPAFITVLAADCDFKDEDSMSSDDFAKVKYFGDWYIDFDANDIGTSIAQVQKFLNKLKTSHEFDLGQAKVYATGSKGFHVIIPQEVFQTKVKPTGIAGLPLIYKEMTMENYVDTVDLKIYSTRRGRQFRTPNVERPDKACVFKVPVTVDECLSMTPDTYSILVSAPRPFPITKKPTFNPSLGVQFESAVIKVGKALKAKAKFSERGGYFTGKGVPPSITRVMSGDVADGVGFQKLATQLAIAAHEIGLSEDDFVTQCEGVTLKHVGDGNRYNTLEKRKAELRRMYGYMQGNLCYTFNSKIFKTLLPKGTNTPDLDFKDADTFLTDSTCVGAGENLEDDDSEQPTQGVVINSNGIFKQTENGMVKVCSLGLTNPKQLVSAGTEEVLGYEVNVHVDGKSIGQRVVDMGRFSSRARFQGFALSVGGASMSGNDNQVGLLADILRRRALKKGERAYVVGCEGLDVVVHGDGSRDTVWADKDGVVSARGLSYRLTGALVAKPLYGTDARQAKKIDDTLENQVFFENFFRVNQPKVIAKLFGWYLASFLCQPIRQEFNQFPSLQIYGPAGSGKSKTTELFGRMFFWRKQVVIPSANTLTAFSLEALVAGSASVPLVVDEFKPREISKLKADKLVTLMRENYTGNPIMKGFVSTESGDNKLDLRTPKNQAPMAMIGEAIFDQDAILQRSILVPMTKDGKRSCGKAYNYCCDNHEVLAGFGHMCIDKALSIQMDDRYRYAALRALLTKYIGQVSEILGEKAADANRPIFNLATLLAGLDFGKSVLFDIFGERFNEQIETLKGCLLADTEDIVPRSMSEASRVLDTFAFMSNVREGEDHERLIINQDYFFDTTGTIEISVRSAYTKYVRHCRGLGDTPLFDTFSAFATGMGHYNAVMDRQCVHSCLKRVSTTPVFRYSLEALAYEGVGDFYKPVI